MAPSESGVVCTQPAICHAFLSPNIFGPLAKATNYLYRYSKCARLFSKHILHNVLPDDRCNVKVENWGYCKIRQSALYWKSNPGCQGFLVQGELIGLPSKPKYWELQKNIKNWHFLQMIPKWIGQTSLWARAEVDKSTAWWNLRKE